MFSSLKYHQSNQLVDIRYAEALRDESKYKQGEKCQTETNSYTTEPYCALQATLCLVSICRA